MSRLVVAADPASPRARHLAAILEAPIVLAPPDSGPAGPAGTLVWTAPWSGRWAMTPQGAEGAAVHVLDLVGAAEACPGRGAHAQDAWSRALVAMCRGATLLLVGSEAERGHWSALIGAAAPHVAVVPHAPEAGPEPASAKKPAPQTVRISGDPADPALAAALEAAIAWARRHGHKLALAAGTPVDAQLWAATWPAADPTQPGWLFDLRRDTRLARASTPLAVASALAAGWPVCTTVDGALGEALAASGAGQVLALGGAALDLGVSSPGPASAARELAHTLFDPEAAASRLRSSVARAEARGDAARRAWRRPASGPASGPAPDPAGASALPPSSPLGRDGRVLVFSDEPEHLVAARVHAPFGALHRRGLIGGYAVMRRGAVVFDTSPAKATRFDAVWVHRSIDPATRLVMQLIARPYAYDIDDNLLATPAHRDRFNPLSHLAVLGLLQGATVVSCATARLGRLLASRVDGLRAQRIVATPNLAQGRPAPVPLGAPTALIWASSDQPAITHSRGDIVRAVRDTCLARGLRLIAVGAAPPPGLAEAGVEVEWVGMLPPAQYQAFLRDLAPAILLCPLDTGADAETQAFIDGKSDIKWIEALSAGVVPVSSRAPPYLDSDLPGQILCGNTYEGWLEGLEAAHAACLAPRADPASVMSWPDARDAAVSGPAPWAQALARARLDRPLALADVHAAHGEAEIQRAPPLTREAFDEAFYLECFDDIRSAVEDGSVTSGYDHYVACGRAEGRLARATGGDRSIGLHEWVRLMHEIDRLHVGTERQDRRTADLERRLALRRTLAGHRPAPAQLPA